MILIVLNFVYLINLWSMHCIKERESYELIHKLEYRNEDIHVYLIRVNNPPKSILAASGIVPKMEFKGSFPLTEQPMSKRSWKVLKIGISINLKVYRCTSMYQFKLMIWESLGVSKLLLFLFIPCWKSYKVS